MIAIRGPGELFGELSLAAQSPRAADAVAMTAVVAQRIGADRLMVDLARRPPSFVDVIDLVTSHVRRDNERQVATTHTSLSRVAAALADLTTRFGAADCADNDAIRIQVPVSHDDIAALAGGTRETTSRSMAALRQRQIVRSERRSIVVTNFAALSALVPV